MKPMKNKIIEKKQLGATLAVSLVILLLLTMLAMSSIKTTIYSEKMTYNFQDREIAFQAAEAAINEAELWLFAQLALPTPLASCTVFPCVLNLTSSSNPETETLTWWNNNASAYTATALNGVVIAPKHLIQFIRFVPDSQTIGAANQTGTYYYKITARGTGLTNESISYIQTVMGLRF